MRAGIFGVVMLVMAGCTGGDDPTGNERIQTELAAKVSVEDVEYQQLPGGARIVTGSLYNPTDRNIANAQIQLSLYDETNTRIGQMIIPVQQIPAGERKEFREPVQSEADVRSVKARSVLVP